MERLTRSVIAHEGLRLKPYRCSVGKLTIGVGRNLDDRGISEAEALYLLQNDLTEIISRLTRFEWFVGLDDVRQRVIVEMGFNLGVPGLMAFRRTLGAVKAGDYERAAHDMLDSLWATQVKGRALVLAQMMATGSDPV